MIIVDTSGIAYALVHDIDNIDLDLFRHALLKNIGYIILELQKYEFSTKEIILACDSRNNWRKEIFPAYKANRKIQRENSKDKVDWEAFFENLNTVMLEFKENMRFKVLAIDGAEADDIISVLCKHRNDGGVTIVSSDKDFRQLCDDKKNVKLMNPKKGKGFIDADDYDLFTHIIKGDASDGVPNVLSNSNVFVDGIRQTTLSAKKKQTLIDYRHNLENAPIMTDEINERIKLNTQLIDLTHVPQNIVDDTLSLYDEYKLPKGKMFSYFVSKQLTKVMNMGVFK